MNEYLSSPPFLMFPVDSKYMLLAHHTRILTPICVTAQETKLKVTEVTSAGQSDWGRPGSTVALMRKIPVTKE